ncbi:MAG: hypothetical protein JNM39_17370 [Bdellovibrionaceae bacterium]|nr:hypothetical protein [Pseudobdellovibrionaceae bacterium]
MKEVRIKLEEPELRALLRGGELTLKSKRQAAKVILILSDIGFDEMQKCLNDAMDEKDHYKPHEASLDL